MSLERLGRRATEQAVQDRRLDFNEVALIEEPPKVLDELRPL